jgi:hypothetical protein
MNSTNPRTITTRLPADLLEQLEQERYTRSRLAGRRISTRMMVESALKEMLSRSSECCPTGDAEGQP